jgi:hypothetical protein
MANTFTSNYNFIKSEIGGDNQSWGDNLHTTLDLTDLAIGKLLEDQIVSGVTSSAINIRKGNTANTISTDSDLKYFESVVIGDKIRVSGSSVTANGTAAVPVIHTVTAKSSANSITVNTSLTEDTATTITIAKVLEPVHINSGPIICAPLTSLSGGATRVAGGTGQPGSGASKDGTDALKANGDVTLGATNADTVTVPAKIASDLIPSTNDKDLGASGSSAWKDLHISGTATLGTAAISNGTLAGITSLGITGTSGSYTNFSIGSNGLGSRTVSTSAPSSTSGYTNGDVWYEIPS